MKRDQLIWTILLVVGGAWLLYRCSTVGVGLVYAQEVDGHFSSVDKLEFTAGTAQVDWMRTLGVWTAAFFTLGIMSFLYRDNPFYKICEAVVVGVSAAYWMVLGFWTVIVPNLLGRIWPAWIQSWAMPGISPLREGYWFINLIPLVFGMMLLWRLAPKGAWIARWPLAFIIGTTAGLRLMGFMQADFLSQIRAGVAPILAIENGSIDFWDTVRSLVMLLSVLACLVYFFFSIEHKGVVGKISKVGIWVLMITFGAAFGYTVMGRIALLAIHLEFLFNEWLALG